MAHSHSTAEPHQIDSASFRTFMFQGRAQFTLENPVANTHISFIVKKARRPHGAPEETRIFNVCVKAIGDHITGKVFIGQIDRKRGILRNSGTISSKHPGVQTINWIIRNWMRLEEYETTGKIKIYHLGYCCKCGMTLTVPESIKNGIGPICSKGREDSSINFLKKNGIELKDASYEELVRHAIEQRPDFIDKIFISDTVRREPGFVKEMSTLKDFGLY